MIEPLILAHLVRDETYTNKVLPFLKKEYFTSPAAQEIFGIEEAFVQKYKVMPTFDAIELALKNSNVTGNIFIECEKFLKQLAAVDRVDPSRRKWLIDETEKHVQSRAIYLALSESIARLDKGPDDAATVPALLTDAVSISFETHIGHDYTEDVGARYDLNHMTGNRLPFDIDLFNKITNGGLLPKTLNVVVSGTAVGKSLFMCHVAAGAILVGKNVLYVTLEMAEERIAERIDANLLDVSLDDLYQMPKPMFESAFASLKSRHNLGKLIIKEYPTSSAHVGHFRSLLNDLSLKKGFMPDLIIIDYINICASQRLKNNGQSNSYTYVKAIAEELRGLAVEFNVPFLSATQFNREGFDSSDPSITNTSESFGLPQTVDLQVALVTSEELESKGLLMVKQLKNRYTDSSRNRRFTVCIDRSKMRVSNDPKQDYLSDPITSAPPKQTREMAKPGLASSKPRSFSAKAQPDIQF